MPVGHGEEGTGPERRGQSTAAIEAMISCLGLAEADRSEKNTTSKPTAVIKARLLTARLTCSATIRPSAAFRCWSAPPTGLAKRCCGTRWRRLATVRRRRPRAGRRPLCPRRPVVSPDPSPRGRRRRPPTARLGPGPRPRLPRPRPPLVPDLGQTPALRPGRSQGPFWAALVSRATMGQVRHGLLTRGSCRAKGAWWPWYSACGSLGRRRGPAERGWRKRQPPHLPTRRSSVPRELVPWGSGPRARRRTNSWPWWSPCGPTSRRDACRESRKLQKTKKCLKSGRARRLKWTRTQLAIPCSCPRRRRGVGDKLQHLDVGSESNVPRFVLLPTHHYPSWPGLAS